jgi:hypothetical protein
MRAVCCLLHQAIAIGTLPQTVYYVRNRCAVEKHLAPQILHFGGQFPPPGECVVVQRRDTSSD